jgi:lysophospholipase L1-like esterase
MAAIFTLAVVAVLATGGLVAGGILLGSAAASPTPGRSLTAAGSGAPIASAVATTPSPTATPTPTPTPAQTAIPLPALLGAIGDSYSQAWTVSPAYYKDHPQFSWVVGTDPNDGVQSLLERFAALGAAPQVVDAATSGKQMNDALRQANLVVAAARKLPAGKTAYVTFELGTNDLCASPDPMTAPATFQTQLQAAIAALKDGLPSGSRVLMLAVPDFHHFYDITQANAAARAQLAETKNQYQCAPYLGRGSPLTVAAADAIRAQYNASLDTACEDINANGGPGGPLHCTYNEALLADSDFAIGDLSTYDFFHPSLTGQARMAADAWAADVWGTATIATPARRTVSVRVCS